MSNMFTTPGGIPYMVVFADQRSKLVEFQMDEGKKPLRVLYTADEPVQDPSPDAYLLVTEEGEVTGIVTLDLASYWGGVERYREHHPEYQVLPAVIIPPTL